MLGVIISAYNINGWNILEWSWELEQLRTGISTICTYWKKFSIKKNYLFKKITFKYDFHITRHFILNKIEAQSPNIT